MPLARITKKNRERIQTTNTRNERGDTSTNPTEVKMIIKEYCGQLCAPKLDNLDEMDQFLERLNVPNLTRR